MRLNTNMSWLLGCWMLSFTFSGCQEDGVEVYPDAPAEDGYFTLTMQNERMLPTQVKTRASDPKEDEEKEIRQLYLFFFGQSGQYLETYQNRFIGFQKPAEGQATVKVDRNAINQLTGGESVIIYAVANVEPELFSDNDGDNMPDNFEGTGDKTPLQQLQEYVYHPSSLSIGLPSHGMPMIGKATVDFSDGSINNSIIELTALMARVDVSLKVDSDEGENNLPSFFLADWTVQNVPAQVSFTAPADGAFTGDLEEKLPVGEQPYGGTAIYNRNGEISLSFYMFENIQDRENKDFVYPDSIADYQKQRYKPMLADSENATALQLHAYYTTYNNFTYEVTYTLYLGANHTDDFKVKRNHQYKNDITIKGIVGHNGNDIGAAGEYTLDARVNILEEGNDFYISILRERNHDAHFCVTPMDVYFFHEDNNPTVEVILDEAATEWIGMELIPAANMADGTVPTELSKTNDALETAWTAGNGKRYYFTKSLVSELNEANKGEVIVTSNRDRIYFYIDENLVLQDREATVTLVYKENGTEKRRRTLTLGQTHLLPVEYVDDDGNRHTIYMEAYEEYLNHYDPLDKFGTEQIYDGLPWAKAGTSLSSNSIPRLYANKAEAWGLVTATNPYAEPQNIYFDGHPYTAFILERMGQIDMKLNDPPVSAFQYCFNKNKRNNDGMVNVSYGFANVNDEYYVISNDTKWFLPGITQMEKALTEYYPTFEEFQNYFYWSASAGKTRTGSGGWFDPYNYPQDSRYARATKAMNPPEDIDSDGTVDYYAISDWDDEFVGHNEKRGKALRTESLRIRAFRIDLEK